MKTQEPIPLSSVRVSVVIAARNASSYIFKSLQAIYRSSYRNLEVIVVDDASTDETRQIASRFPCRVISLPERCGPGKARNIGVAASTGDIIFFTDADVLVTQDAIEKAVRILGENQEISAIIGCYTRQIPEQDFVSTYKNLLHHYVHHRSAGAVIGFFTACGAIRREAFELVGGFDESAIDCALEDLDLGMRLHGRGRRIVLFPDIQVTHMKRYTLRSLIQSDFRQRAIPYTVLMLRNRVFPDQLSTKRSDRASVFLAYLFLLLLACSLVADASWAFVASAAVAFAPVLYLNRRFYGFLLKEKGAGFLPRAIAMQVLTYLLSGLGLMVGLFIYFFRGAGQSDLDRGLSHSEAQSRSAFSGLTLPRPNPNIMSVVPHQPARPETGLIRMAFNENPVGPSPLALDAIRSALLGLNRYPDSRGTDLKRALARKHEIEPENIILGQGASDILEMITRAFLCPGDEIVIPDPTFPYYKMLGELCGCSTVSVPLCNHTVDLLAVASAVTARTKIIFIANPNNPTGTVVRQADIERFLDRVGDHLVIVFDEAYIDYVIDENIDTVRLLSRRPLVVVRTFSKILGLAGNRIGYGMADPAIIETLARLRRPYNTCSLAQAAALASLEDYEHLEKTIQTVAQGRSFLCREFDRLGLDYVPSHTNFILVDLRASTEKVTKELHSRGFLVRPMPPTSIRVSVGTAEQNRGFIKGLEFALQKTGRQAETADVSIMPSIPALIDAFKLRGDFAHDYTDQSAKP
ncbi:MAG TPA: histidinol-phosphate transaminase [Blastocatellia bacterium]|nr:histidinol-phosphate transaminase [Blastocatellia bacterium]